MSSNGKRPGQPLLVAADEQYQGRRQSLFQALDAVKARLGVTTFVKLVFEKTGGGSQALSRTYKQFAEAGPDWFGSESAETIRGWVEQATTIGLVTKQATFLREGSRGANQYRINWSGVDAIVSEHRRRFDDGRADPTTIWQRLQGSSSPGLPDQTPGLPDQANKSFISCINSSCISIPDPEPDPVPVQCPEGWSRKKSRTISIGDLARLPEIAANLQRRVQPLPAGDLIHGAFTPLKPKTFERPEPSVMAGSLAIWFRRQLSAPQPICGDSVAELIVIIASGLYASSLPAVEVKKNRAAVFVTTLSRELWFRITRFVGPADDALQQTLAHFPELLDCADGAWQRSAEGVQA